MDAGRDQVHELRTEALRPLEDTVRECAGALQPLHPDVEFLVRSQGGAIVCEAVRDAPLARSAAASAS